VQDLRTHCNTEFTRVDRSLETSMASLETRVTEFQENLARNSVNEIKEQIKEMQKMEESQNFVLKDCHEKTQNMLKRIVELEKTDFDDKFNHITRRMIGEVVREHLTPIQMNFNLENKSIKKLVEEHAYTIE